MVYRFIIGDPYDDGHGYREEFFVSSNKDEAAILKIDKEAQRTVFGFSIYDIHVEYGEHAIEQSQLDKLISMGFQPSKSFDQEYVIGDDFIQIWLFMLMKVDPELKLEVVEKPAAINFPYSPGYGLYE